MVIMMMGLLMAIGLLPFSCQMTLAKFNTHARPEFGVAILGVAVGP
jgi:hypothetical protein